jgi:hypothetical protein
MRQMDLPTHAAETHGYAIEWRNEDHTRAVLRKGDEELRANLSPEGDWSYENRHKPADRGDILDFEAQRGAKTRANARESLRPELERWEQERGMSGPTHQQQDMQRTQTGPEHDGPDLDPNRRRGRGR